MPLRRRHQSGISLIELMVATVLGLLISASIVGVFLSTSSSSRVQTQLAQLQEEGRYAMTRLGKDLRMANGQYCSNTGGVALPASNGLYLDHLRAPTVYATNLIGAAGALSGALSDNTTAWGGSSGSVKYPAAPSAPYSMPAFLFMRGYDCSLTGCTPIDPAAAGLPAMGKTVNSRVVGASVLTLRYINPDSGWAIGNAGGSSVATASSTGTIASISLKPLAGEPPASRFASGDLAMLADCSNAQIFATSGNGTLKPDATQNFAGNGAIAPPPQAAPKLFDVNRDFQTVTYYLKVVSLNNDGSAPFTGALMRRVNGGLKKDGISPARPGASEDELVRGIERLDFKYGVQDAAGNTSFLTAAQIEASSNCPPAELNALTSAGCLWRGISSIEVSVLMDGQAPLYSLATSAQAYAYSPDGAKGGTAPTAPESHGIRPQADQGFVVPMLRREFNALVAIRNYNP